MANDDDILTDPVPPPEAEPTAAERSHAKSFGELVDKTLAGRTPAAMTTDDRALIEVATVIRAAHGNALLSAAKRRSAVEDALKQVVSAGAPVIPMTRARTRRWAPWAIAGTTTLVAAAAMIALWVRAPVTQAPRATAAALPTEWRSRPADPLIGPISHEHAGDASTRIDAIFADRLDGYREHRLERRRMESTERKP